MCDETFKKAPYKITFITQLSNLGHDNRARVLDFHPAAHTEELGSILLRVSAIGIFTYSVFSIMAGALSPSSAEEPPVLVLITGLLTATEVNHL